MQLFLTIAFEFMVALGRTIVWVERDKIDKLREADQGSIII